MFQNFFRLQNSLWFMFLTISQSLEIYAAVFLEPLAAFSVVWKYFFHFCIELLWMIHVLSMTQLMNHNAVQNLKRHQNQKTIKIQVAIPRTTTPSCFLKSYENPIVINTADSCIMLNSLLNHIPCFFLQFPDFALTQNSQSRCYFFLFLNLRNLFLYPFFFSWIKFTATSELMPKGIFTITFKSEPTVMLMVLRRDFFIT